MESQNYRFAVHSVMYVYSYQCLRQLFICVSFLKILYLLQAFILWNSRTIDSPFIPSCIYTVTSASGSFLLVLVFLRSSTYYKPLFYGITELQICRSFRHVFIHLLVPPVAVYLSSFYKYPLLTVNLYFLESQNYRFAVHSVMYVYERQIFNSVIPQNKGLQ